MTAQLDPSTSQISRETLHFELAQGCRSSLPGVIFSEDGKYTVEVISADDAELFQSKVVRLFSESILHLNKGQLKVFMDLCFAAHRSEQFFLTLATDQWLRTAIKSDRACQELTQDARCRIKSDMVIHSNVLPYNPYWPKPRATRDGAGCLASKTVHFPCSIVKEASEEGKKLVEKLHEWQGECELGKHVQERSKDGNNQQQGPSKLFWDIRADVVTRKSLTRDGTISLVTWKGGTFIRKAHLEPKNFDIEVKVLEKLCHPHIVYIFGMSCDEMQRSLYMECMESDLLTVILDPNIRPEGGNMGPPFSHHDSVDLLLQIAKAMAHMHENKVIHGDLKSPNILISKFEISENQYQYLAKVADFGSAQIVKDPATFKAPGGTTYYAAPEVLKFRDKKIEAISVPEYIDVYSFGLVAFEVLTGKCMEHVYKSMSLVPRQVKEGVIDGTLRPPLREECKGDFLNDESLISLLESCWHDDPLDGSRNVVSAERPSFSKIVEVLESVKLQILKAATSQSDPPPRQANFVHTDASGAPEEAASGSNGHHPPQPVLSSNTSDALHDQAGKSKAEGCCDCSGKFPFGHWRSTSGAVLHCLSIVLAVHPLLVI